MTDLNCKFNPQSLKTSIIQIHSYEDKNFEGILQNGYYTEKKAFGNLTQLLLFMETMQDDLGCSDKYMESRTFTQHPPQPLQLPEPQTSPPSTLATFQVQLLFRQNASWQGNVIWVEKKTEAQFRSVLELVTLMDSVLC